MRILCMVACFLAITVYEYSAHALGNEKHWIVEGYYGEGFVNPSDINSVSNAQSTTPRLNSLSTATVYGGSLGYMLSHKFELRAAFDIQDAKNGVKTTSPYVASSAGFELQQNEIWGTLNYYLVDKSGGYVYLGAGAGYPTWCHAIETFSTQTSFDGAKTVGYIGQAGAGVNLGTTLTLFVQAAYEGLNSGNVTTASGTTLKNSTGTNATINLSGLRAVGGLGIRF